jgi:hypothetical protein
MSNQKKRPFLLRAWRAIRLCVIRANRQFRNDWEGRQW